MLISFDSILLFWSALVGLVVGSFLNVLIYRLPRGFHSSLPSRSSCTSCFRKILWYENIPILSYLFQKGRCAGCGTKFSARYPLVEFMTALLFFAVFKSFGFNLTSFYYSFLLAYLIAITFIDIDFRVIPDELSYSGIVIGLAFSHWIMDHSFYNSILGVVSGGGMFWLLAKGYEKMTGREGLGFGDVKLLAMIGAFIGAQGVLLTIVASSFIGSICGLMLMVIQRQNLKMAIPFGPFLSMGAMIFIFWKDYYVPIFRYY